MSIKSRLLGLIVLLVIFGGIGLTMAFNLWHTETEKVPVTFTEGEFAGEYNPADIRGSYTLGDISDTFEIPLSDLAAAFGLEDLDDPGSFQVKGLETLYANLEGTEIGTDSVRIFTALYTGLPYTLADSTYLPQAAVDILKAKANNLTEEETAFLDSHGIDISNIESPPPPEETEQSEPVEEEAPTEEAAPVEKLIDGKTTFGQLLEWGLTETDIEAIIEDKIPGEDISVRSFLADKGLEFAAAKEALQALVDGLP